jgi:hypothetical protein
MWSPPWGFPPPGPPPPGPVLAPAGPAAPAAAAPAELGDDWATWSSREKAAWNKGWTAGKRSEEKRQRRAFKAAEEPWGSHTPAGWAGKAAEEPSGSHTSAGWAGSGGGHAGGGGWRASIGGGAASSGEAAAGGGGWDLEHNDDWNLWGKGGLTVPTARAGDEEDGPEEEPAGRGACKRPAASQQKRHPLKPKGKAKSKAKAKPKGKAKAQGKHQAQQGT